jgi:hypothetical protein
MSENIKVKMEGGVPQQQQRIQPGIHPGSAFMKWTNINSKI